MGRAKYVVELAEEERVRLRSLLRGGKASVRMVTRARVLLKADEGYTDGAIAAALGGGHCYGGQDSQSALLKRDWSIALREQPETGTATEAQWEARSPCDRGGMQYPA